MHWPLEGHVYKTKTMLSHLFTHCSFTKKKKMNKKAAIFRACIKIPITKFLRMRSLCAFDFSMQTSIPQSNPCVHPGQHR